MKISKRRLIGVLGAASVAASLAACTTVSTGNEPGSSGSTNPNGITIAGVFGNTFDPFWTSLGCGAATKAKQLGVTYKEFSSTNNDNATFDQLFNSASLINPDGMLVNPLNPDQFDTQYQKLLAKGVPVVTINATTPVSQYRIVGTDVSDLSFLGELDKLIAGQSGKLAIVDGVSGLVPVESRLKPVVDEILKQNPGLTALEPAYTGFDSAKATAAASAFIVGNPDLKVIVAADGPDGAATAAAVKAAGKSGQILVVALDATPPEVAALKDGTITALVAQAPKQIGAKQLQTLVDYLKSAKAGTPITASSESTNIPQRLLTKSNVDDPANSDWVYTADTCH